MERLSRKQAGGGGSVLTMYLALVEEPWEKEWLRMVYERYYRRMLGQARRYLAAEERAEDAVHNAFLHLIGHLERLRDLPEERLGGYLSVAVRNECLTLLRRERPTVPLEDWGDFAAQAESSEAEDIAAVIRAMPETYRAALEMKFLQERTDREIAQALQLSEGAVRVRISRGRALLQQKLREEGYTP